MALRKRVKTGWSTLTVAQKEARLRAAITPAEALLSAMLDSHPSTKGRYQHQKCIHGYFPDFSFPHCRLIVELDGSVHRGRAAKAADARRSAKLASKGWRVIRFWNSDLRRPQKVMWRILEGMG